MPCRRCSGKGTLSIKLGKPNPERDNHARYAGVWCIYPTVPCSWCRGTGYEKYKPPPRPYRGPISIRNQGEE